MNGMQTFLPGMQPVSLGIDISTHYKALKAFNGIILEHRQVSEIFHQIYIVMVHGFTEFTKAMENFPDYTRILEAQQYEYLLSDPEFRKQVSDTIKVIAFEHYFQAKNYGILTPLSFDYIVTKVTPSTLVITDFKDNDRLQDPLREMTELPRVPVAY